MDDAVDGMVDGWTGTWGHLIKSNLETFRIDLDECACSEKAYGDDSSHRGGGLDVGGHGLMDGQRET